MQRFLKVYSKVSKFAVDHETAPRSRKDQSEVHDHELSELLGIQAQDFLEHLYRHREEDESKILRRVTTADFFCLVGPEGAGKSSLVHSVVRALEATDSNQLILLFDLRELTSYGEFVDIKEKLDANPELFSAFLRARARERYKRLFFMPNQVVNGKNAELALYEYLLAVEQDNHPGTLFDNLSDLQSDTYNELRFYRSNGHDQATLYEFLERTRFNGPIKEIVAELKSNIDLRHYVFALESIYGYRRQLIWYENADALKPQQQKEIFQYVANTHANLAQFTASALSIRAENIRRYEIEAGAPPEAEYHVLSREDNVAVPALDLHDLDAATLGEIVELRLEFARERHTAAVNRTQAKLARFTRTISECKREIENPILGKKRRQKAKNKISRAESEIRFYQRHEALLGPELTEAQYRTIREISAILMRRLDAEKALALSNNSLRQFLKLHCDLLKRCVGLLQNEKDDLRDHEDWYVSTLILRWLRRSGQPYQLGVHDLIATTKIWKSNGRRKLGCSPAHLIATTVWNLQSESTLGGRPASCPTVAMVFSRLSKLGYEKPELAETCFLMFHENGRKGSLLDFRPFEPMTSLEIKDDYEIFLTLRGRCLVGRICNSFGYIYECSEESTRSPQRTLAKPERFNTHDAIEALIPVLCELGEMYLHGLREVRDKFDNSHFWLDDYLQYFGIPCFDDDQLTPTTAGRLIGDLRRPMQFQALLNSLENYAKSRKEESMKDSIIKLAGIFERRLEELRRFGKEEAGSLFRLMGVSPVFTESTDED